MTANSIKVRQQLRTQSTSRPPRALLPTNNLLTLVCAAAAPGAASNSFWAVGLEMARTEGIRSLAGGVSASVLREVVYSGMRMGTYEFFKDK